MTNLQGDIVMIVDANGVSQAEYRYNAWGELLSSSGALADINPLRYRSYYFDQESGLYYLKSRYYDPKICRFINADGLASTGQGFIGANMFAYCNNSPVIHSDSTGHSPISAVNEIIKRIKNGLAKITGAAREYPGDNYYSDSTYNCAGYALDQADWINIKNYSPGDTLEKTAENLILTAKAYNCNIRPIDYYYSSVGENEYRIAMRVGPGDYHFMRQNKDGTWSEKCGALMRRTHNCYDPDEITWDSYEVTPCLSPDGSSVVLIITEIYMNYYNSNTLFFAVSPVANP